jgi:hypothetical protein
MICQLLLTILNKPLRPFSRLPKAEKQSNPDDPDAVDYRRLICADSGHPFNPRSIRDWRQRIGVSSQQNALNGRKEICIFFSRRITEAAFVAF